MSVKEARKTVEELDRQREAFVREHFHHKAADPHMDDLVINIEMLVQEDAADLIVGTPCSATTPEFAVVVRTVSLEEFGAIDQYHLN